MSDSTTRHFPGLCEFSPAFVAADSILGHWPQGRVKGSVNYPKKPYAGPLSELQATGTVDKGGVTIRSTTSFRSSSIDMDWAINRKSGGKQSATVHFPTWGPGSSLTAIMKNGQQVTIANNQQVTLADVNYFYLRSQETGYVMVPGSAASGVAAHAATVACQKSNPLPGPL